MGGRDRTQQKDAGVYCDVGVFWDHECAHVDAYRTRNVDGSLGRRVKVRKSSRRKY
jgi:adenine deaminase